MAWVEVFHVYRTYFTFLRILDIDTMFQTKGKRYASYHLKMRREPGRARHWNERKLISNKIKLKQKIYQLLASNCSKNCNLSISVEYANLSRLKFNINKNGSLCGVFTTYLYNQFHSLLSVTIFFMKALKWLWSKTVFVKWDK